MRKKERGQVPRRAAPREQSVRLRAVTDQSREPAHDSLLNLCRRRSRAPGGDVGIKRRSQQVCVCADRSRGRSDVTEESRMTVMATRIDDRAALIEYLFHRSCFERQLATEAAADLRGAGV